MQQVLPCVFTDGYDVVCFPASVLKPEVERQPARKRILVGKALEYQVMHRDHTFDSRFGQAEGQGLVQPMEKLYALPL